MNHPTQHPTAYYGGTFDPIHNGHIGICKSLAGILDLKSISLLPNHIPPHRPQPLANPNQRLDMLKLAIQDSPLFNIDARELNKHTYSYTIETLIELRAEIGKEQPLMFIIGEDSLFSICKWHKWDSLLNYCHLVVCTRENSNLKSTDPIFINWLNVNLTEDKNLLLTSPSGLIYLAETPNIDISATQIRNAIETQQNISELVPRLVKEYIEANSLYTRLK